VEWFVKYFKEKIRNEKHVNMKIKEDPVILSIIIDFTNVCELNIATMNFYSLNKLTYWQN